MEAQDNRAGDASLSIEVRKQLSDSFSLDAAFEVPPGFTMLLGPSGAGKTTLLNCISGILRPDSGRIRLGTEVLFDSAAKISVSVRARRLGYLFQTLALFPHLTVKQNVEYGIARLPSQVRHTRMITLLDSFRVAHLLEQKPNEISGGERQRVALARSLVTNPAALLLDEPLVALDTFTKAKILDDLRGWNAANQIPILYVTHSPEEAFAVGERVVILDSGRVLDQGPPQEVLTKPRHETVAQIVGFENVFDAIVKSTTESPGTMRCHLDGSGVDLETPLTDVEVGARVRIAIRAGDIMVAVQHPQGLSARNVIQGELVSLAQMGPTMILRIEAGVTFEVHATPGACKELGLAAGQPIWMVIKTYSCSLLDRTRKTRV
jgi:molybdate transport system ATP-binding protein